ncbi:MAG TPA: hypothetical protein VFN09_07080, partial [Rhodanobacteraceae bacterium]|nr:hypothetical protein [Rhodanobacteraceae bacterium]
EAYVLAGELGQHPGDIAGALARYQQRLLPVLARKQRFAESLVASFVPRTEFGVRARDAATRLMRLPLFPKLLMGRYLSDEIALPDYPPGNLPAVGGAAERSRPPQPAMQEE